MQAATFLQELETFFRLHQNEENARPMKQYMRNQFDFLGIKTPQRRELLRQFLKDHPLAEHQLETVVKGLWNLPEREFQYLAIGILERTKKTFNAEDIDLLEYLITHKSWWDTVDGIATNLVGDYVKEHPQRGRTYMNRWIDNPNLWLKRSAILHQLKYKAETDEALLYAYIVKCKDSQEFFIQKAIGWALREYAKTNPGSVRRFVEETDLPALSRREALKHIG
ncbi:3-methyladenine DNA glycosylase AlkD [Caldalkalibacillus uzonensis]|uniref:3-methyladenine DNA glycosylase AlkD n=1 Tax=Caldalkalibacillus uzonensis TaxID=353224 RepID=A0ABU0CW73_9BACI|nr:DNA alkylation repair protein [Caldalkalibacillus uzonensis]MDQ0340674.1 3-methyladenine DNA glycosylase AlkD [Caldalkalibacillus uzonensis]